MNTQHVPVSVIIPTWRCAPLAAEAVASVYDQTWRPYEVIIVDDASGDGTVEQLQELTESYPTGWLKVVALERNGGPGSARNMGWDMANGNYIAFLDADDFWHPRKVELQYGWMTSRPDAAVSGTRIVELNGQPALNAVRQDDAVDFRRVNARQQLLRNRFGTSTVMLPRNIKQRFESGKRFSEDFLLWTSIILAGGSAYTTTAELCGRRKAPFGEGGLTGDLPAMLKGQLESYRALARNGLLRQTASQLYQSVAVGRYGVRCARVKGRHLAAKLRGGQ
jgi:glycosyltransferase involved in cell wall biosynthesis